MRHTLPLILCLAALGSARPLAAQAGGTPPLGCYRADRPLGTAGPATPRLGAPLQAAAVPFDDSTAHYFRLD